MQLRAIQILVDNDRNECHSPDDTPDYHARREIERGATDIIQEDIGGDLHSDITDVKRTEQCGELVAVQTQVFLESAESGRGGIIPVDL